MMLFEHEVHHRSQPYATGRLGRPTYGRSRESIDELQEEQRIVKFQKGKRERGTR